MKKIILKITIFTIISSIFISCDMNDPNDGDFNVNPRSGWIQYQKDFVQGEVNARDSIFKIPFEINVPVNENGFVVSYNVEAIEGTAPESQIGSFTTTVAKEKEQSFITIPLVEDISENYTLKIQLTGVNDEDIKVGILGSNRPISFELDILCGVPENRYVDSTWNVNSTVCAGNGNGSCDPANSDIPLTSQVTLIAGDNPKEFELSDITGGLYEQLYGASDNPVTVTDDCNQLVVSNQPDVVFGGDEFNGTGSITLNDNGDLIEFEITWSNNFGDAGTSVFTPAD